VTVAQAVGEPLRAVASTFRNRDLRRLELALLGSVTGYWMYSVALAVYAFDEGGAGAVGFVYALRMVLGAVSSPFTAALADRYSRQRVMLASDLLRVVALAGATVAVTVGAPLAVVAAAVGVVAIVGTAFHPAQAALLPSLARTPEELSAANAVSNLIDSVAIFVGPALGAALLAVTGVEVVFAATAAATLWSAVLVAGVARDEAPSRADGAERAAPHLLEGFRTLATEPRLRSMTALGGTVTLTFGVANVLIVVLALEVLETGDAGLGLLLAALGIGGVAGAVPLIGAVARRPADVLLVTTAATGIAIALLGATTVPAIAFAAAIAYGAVRAASELADTTLLQRAVPNEVLGRVFGVLEAVYYATIAIGAALAPALADALGVRGALFAAGTLLVAVTALVWRPIATLRAVAAPVERIELLRRIPIFTPLPAPVVEHLARQLDPVHAPAGTQVFAQGDPGDRFYAIAAGDVEVRLDGRPTRRLGAGEAFGEIALLRDTPRTATVMAVTDVDLLALDRDEFVAAVTGHAESAEAANALISSRLAAPRVGAF
jgi:predicted MFS family arabinose efflux permease